MPPHTWKPGPGGAARDPDLIRRENSRPGTRDWLLTNTRIDPATKYRCPWIEGYASRTSLRAGERMTLHVSTNPASAFMLDIYRLGYYGGAGGRHVISSPLISRRSSSNRISYGGARYSPSMNK